MILPEVAFSLKQILHISNFLIYPPFRPHSGQRLYTRVGNFGALPCARASMKAALMRRFFTLIEVRAMFLGKFYMII